MTRMETLVASALGYIVISRYRGLA